VDADGLLLDVDVQDINDETLSREEKRRDVNQFFEQAVIKEVNGKKKQYCACKRCP
jgi:hypothetical protein